jgi:hypothetical protein
VAITIAGCLMGSALAGCGHKASDADCRVIIDRMIEVRLDARKVMDPEAREREKQDMRGPGSGIDTKDCVGRRITDGQLECVKAAKSEDEITSCLR